MKKILLLSFLLISCTNADGIETFNNHTIDFNDFEYIENYAVKYADALYKKQTDTLIKNSLANNCSDICLLSGINNASDFVEKTLKDSDLNNIKFEAQNIRYFDNEQQVQILLHGIDSEKNKGIALLFNLRLIGDIWKLNLSNFVKNE